MKKIISFLVALGFAACMGAPVPALADRVDSIRAQGTFVYCDTRTRLFANGADGRYGGHARVIKEATPGIVELAMHNMVPKDGLYFTGWKDLTKDEQEWMTKQVFDGWDFADLAITKHSDSLDNTEVLMAGPDWALPTVQWVLDAGTKYFEACMAEESAKKPETDAKSENMRNPEKTKKSYEQSKG